MRSKRGGCTRSDFQIVEFRIRGLFWQLFNEWVITDHRKFDSPTHDLGGPRSDHVFEIEPEILQAIEEEPNLNIRKLALCVGVSTFIVYRTLHLFYNI
jgi:hypothetical protein